VFHPTPFACFAAHTSRCFRLRGTHPGYVDTVEARRAAAVQILIYFKHVRGAGVRIEGVQITPDFRRRSAAWTILLD
jgi:hypothetical protein